ncbi:MAG: phenylacetic acid degradation operon negative regulatory protein [Parcubacteria group bacterium Athens0714_25]|nr:MAG: phenylacetic acid degradation operon negative regulatory protein [Parcubacteria group bacterium Athens0714_25]
MKTISKCILATIGIAGIFTIAAIAPNSFQMLELFGLSKKKYKPKSVGRALNRMKKQKLIEIKKEKNDKITIQITERGKKRLLEYNIDELQIKIPEKWDGKWRIVSFDIPEKRKKAREAFREKLRDLGFYPFQKSLFIFPFACSDEIDFISEIFEIKKHIVYFETSNINNKYKIKRYFNLN